MAERRQRTALTLGRRALVPSHGRRANRSSWVAVRGLESISDRGVHIGAYSSRPSWGGTGERDDRSRLAKSRVLRGCGWQRRRSRPSPVWAAAPGCMAEYLWPSPARRPLEPRIFPCRIPRERGPRPAFLAHAPAAPKFVAPAGAQRCACPSPASRGLRLCAVFPAMTDRHRNGAQPHKMEKDHA